MPSQAALQRRERVELGGLAHEVDRHAQRLLFAQLVSVACFIAFPLRFSFERPESSGLFGALFTALGSFDKPFNQAPSLHIALLIIVWVRLTAHVGTGFSPSPRGRAQGPDLMRYLLDTNIGLVNQYLGAVGLDSTIPWLTQVEKAGLSKIAPASTCIV